MMEPTIIYDDPDVLNTQSALQDQYQSEQQEDADRRQLAQDVQTALALLDGNATLAQTRAILARLIRLLVRTGAISA